MTLRIVPCTIQDAKDIVRRWHRHNRPPVSGLFAVACEGNGELCGVAIVGRPVARMLQDGVTCEVLRVATDGTHNACSMLYGACTRAAKALGYARAVTYTLQSESGSSLRACGWQLDASLPARDSWSCSSRDRVQRDLFGRETRPAGPKFRWTKML